MTIEYISQAGLLGVGAIAIFLTYLYFKKKLDETPVSNPQKHRFFNLVEYELLNRIPNIKLYHNEVYCKGRTELFRDILQIKFKHWEDGLKEAMVMGNDKMSDNELQSLLERATLNFVKGYQREWKDTLQLDKDKIALVTNKFNKWHQSKVEMYMDSIRGICQGNSFSSVREKANAFLEVNCSMLVLTIIDAEESLGSLNGDLSGTQYKDNIIK